MHINRTISSKKSNTDGIIMLEVKVQNIVFSYRLYNNNSVIMRHWYVHFSCPRLYSVHVIVLMQSPG